MAGLKSKKWKSPWGIHKTRSALHSRRLNRAISVGRNGNKSRSPIPMGYFNRALARFHESWGK